MVIISLYILMQIAFSIFVIVMCWLSPWALITAIITTVFASIGIIFNVTLLLVGCGKSEIVE